MADLKISQLPALGDNLATADKIAVVDGSASETKSLTIANLFSANSFGLLGSNAIPIAKVSVTAGSIAGTAIADLGISTAKVANDAITAAKLDNNSSAQVVTSLPGSGGFTGQIAANSNDGYAASIWDGSAWQSLKAAASINSITGDTTSIVNIAVATSGSTRALSASIDDSSAAAQFLAGPSGAAGAVSLRAITGADLPLATSTAQGTIKINGEGLRIDTGVIEIDNDVSASSAYNLVAVTAKGLVSAYRTITAADLPAGTTSAKGALQVGTGLAVSSGVISIDNTASAGTYTKVVVTASGLVSSGSQITDTDLPNHSAALLTSGTVATARLGTKSVTAAKLGDASTVVFQSIAQVGSYPSPAFQGQLLFDTTTEDCFVHDGTAWQAISSLSKGALIPGGTYNASTSKVDSVTSAGAAAGLVVGSNLPTASATTDSLYVVVSVQGTPSGITGITGQLKPPDYILGVTNTSSSSWVEIDLSQTVASQVAANIAFTPYGGLSSTNLQDVLQEVETEKLSKTGGTVSGEILISNAGSLVYEGATADSFETTIGVVDPTTADKTINFPDQSGTVLVSGGASIVNADVATNAALAYSKLAALASGSILVGNGSNVATVQAVSGDATLSNAGVLTIAASAITNSKISSSAAIGLSKLATGALPTAITVTNANVVSSAAIAGTKISPDFGTQAITTTGNLTLNNQADLRLGDSDGSHYVAIQSGATVGTSYTIELPTTVGATGKVLKSTVSGQVATLTWETDATDDAAANLTGTTLASNVVSSSLTSVGTLTGLVVNGDATFTGASSNVVWSKSANAFTGTIAATAFSGPLTGNVTGNASGSAATVTGAAQSAITSLGTLTSLGISGNLTVDTNTLHVDATNNRVGIGNASPNSLLNIHGVFETNAFDNANGQGGRVTTGGLLIGDAYTAGKTTSDDRNAIIWNERGLAIAFGTNNAERMQIDSSGKLLVNRNAAYGSGKAQIFNTSQYLLDLSAWSADANGPTVDFYKSRNGTIGSSTVVQDNDVVGKLRFLGNDGANSRTAAQITAQVDGTPGTNDMPGRLVFSTTADGASSPTERMQVTSGGDCIIGATSGSHRLTVQGSGTEIARFLGANGADLKFRNSTSNDFLMYTGTSDRLLLGTNGQNVALTLDVSQNATFAGTVSDSKGDLRNIPMNYKTGAYTLLASDAGKHIMSNSSVTIPASVMAEGNAVTIVNMHTGDMTITQASGLTMYNTADASTGNRVLATRGMATILFTSSTTAYMSGAGLS